VRPDGIALLALAAAKLLSIEMRSSSRASMSAMRTSQVKPALRRRASSVLVWSTTST
jgi:hypothetical protein